MEIPLSTILFTDDDTQNLDRLLYVFGSVVSLDGIVKTYGKVDWNLTIAVDILVEIFEEVGDSVILFSESISEIDAKRAGPEERDEKTSLGDVATSATLPTSVEEFIFKMVRSGFSLDMSVIKDVEKER
ncbi:hypothetical protein RND71_014511 [Anisodus tanguticus]|uniref:Uncharacterized protein n=1 Tax=Anisodus tanguticus TaxID=243964 RepID=A0AAE1SBE3_9SOLA|nr:hypothetical protein RND71_014511 [Anisodus tanguticus]